MLRPLQRIGLLQAGQCDDPAVADGRRFLVGHAGRLVRQRALLSDADVLRVGAASDPEHLVADRELGDGCADRLDLSSQLHADDPPLRAQQPGEDAREERARLHGSRSRSA